MSKHLSFSVHRSNLFGLAVVYHLGRFLVLLPMVEFRLVWGY